MIPPNNIKRSSKRRLSEFNERLSLLAWEIHEISESYLELTEIDDNTHTARAESYLLGELSRLCGELSFYANTPRVTDSVKLDEDD